MENLTLERDDDEQVERLVRSGLAGPARPLRGDQLDRLVRLAARRGAFFPLWALLPLAAAPLVVAIFGWLSGWNLPGQLELVLLIPLANLAFSPVAAYIVLKRAS